MSGVATSFTGTSNEEADSRDTLSAETSIHPLSGTATKDRTLLSSLEYNRTLNVESEGAGGSVPST